MREQVRWLGIFFLPLVFSIVMIGCSKALQKPVPQGPIDRTKEQKVFTYSNEAYDWILANYLTRWINWPLWHQKLQPGIVYTEKGWGILKFDGTWLLKPQYEDVQRIVNGAETNYPTRVFARLKRNGEIYLIDDNGKSIDSYTASFDPYQAIERVKSMTVYYVREYGSVFSVNPDSVYDSSTNLGSYVKARFESAKWNAFEPAGECNGWIVRLKAQTTKKFIQQWLVTAETIYELKPKREDYIRSTASTKSKKCIGQYKEMTGESHTNISKSKQIIRRKNS